MKSSELKKWWRSGSWQFVVDSRAQTSANIGATSLGTVNWQGNTLHFRPGTSDCGVIYEILMHPGHITRPNRTFFRGKKLEYWVPEQVAPRTILDMGGNIGVTSVYYAQLFPDAKIHVFEPVKDNFAILEKNAANSANIIPHNVGLGDRNEQVDIYQCNEAGNAGGFSLYDLDVDKSQKQTIELRNANEYIKEHAITDIDLIKIDTEGAEYDILTSLDPAILSNVKWIIGELHGNQDFELLAYLSQWFDINLNKNLNHRLSFFNARNKNCADSIPWRA